VNLSAVFIRRPATTTLLTLGIMVFGLMAYRQLPVSDLPAVDFPTIQVQAALPGASPETMASSVALPLEKQFASIPGLTSTNSSSNQGSTSITLQFDLDRDIDAAAQDVQAMIGRASRSLPPQMPAPPSYQSRWLASRGTTSLEVATVRGSLDGRARTTTVPETL
jgi:HAE1 family hydrophobic/amphiphilic exporter-1